MKKAVWNVVGRAAIAGVMLTGISCGELTRQGTSASYLIVDVLEAAPGAEPEEFGGTLLSDVVTVVDDTPTFFNDVGRVTFRLGLKDPGPPTSPNTPTQNNFITVNRYRVSFIRADGRNTPGVDVPHGFDGAFTVTVGAGTAQGGFTIVRNIAKLEAPLRALQTNLLILSTIAEVTFFGHDQTGREVMATARISIDFANFGDPQ
jgi:hypothetical protein